MYRDNDAICASSGGVGLERVVDLLRGIVGVTPEQLGQRMPRVRPPRRTVTVGMIVPVRDALRCTVRMAVIVTVLGVLGRVRARHVLSWREAVDGSPA